jgi:DNA-binding LacI/PurR family transcriptional regulator
VVTIADVAGHAGVSASTVSYVLSGKRSISEETAERVRASIVELGYRPNARAAALASRRANAIALVAPLRADNNVPVIMQFVAAAAMAARARNHDVLLVTQEEGVAGLERVSSSSLVDAVIVMDVEIADRRIPMLTMLEIPAVMIGHPGRSHGISTIDLDMAGAAELAVQHLAELGHRSIAMLGSPSAVYERKSSYAFRFREGFERARTDFSVEGHWYPVEPSYQSTREVLQAHLAWYPETTGLVVHNESILGEVLAVLADEGLRVPEDVSLVALCPPDLAVNQRVALTSIAVPTDDIGAAAVDMVLGLVDGTAHAESRLITPVLTIRSSTAGPRPAAQPLDDETRTP